MAVQTDVKAKNMTATGAAGVGRCRIKAIYFVGTTGSVSIKNGGSGATELIKLDAGSANYLLLPGEGVQFTADPYVTLTTVTSITFFYG